MKKTVLTSFMLLASFSASAYQFEVDGVVGYYDSKLTNGNYDGGVQGTYYLNNIDSSKGPLAEAAFLNQATSVSAAYNYGRLTADDVQGKVKSEQQSYGVKAEGYYPVDNIPLYGSVSYNHSKTKPKNDFTAANYKEKDSGDRYAVELGAVVMPNLLVALGYTHTAQDSLDAFDILQNGIVNAGIESRNIDDKKDSYTARLKYLGPIQDTGMSIGFETKLAHGASTMYGIKSDLYVTPQLGFGIGYVNSDHTGGTIPTSAVSVDTSYFVTQNISLGAAFIHGMNDNGGKNVNSGNISAKFRF